MPTSRWPAVVDALLATFTAVPDLTVFDGPEFGLTSEAIGEFVIVGGDGTPDGEPGSIEQGWAGLGAHARDEQGEVNCAVVVQSGDTAIKPSRDRAFVLLGYLETAIVADPTLGGAVASGWLMPLTGEPAQRENKLGSYVQIPVKIGYKARI